MLRRMAAFGALATVLAVAPPAAAEPAGPSEAGTQLVVALAGDPGTAALEGIPGVGEVADRLVPGVVTLRLHRQADAERVRRVLARTPGVAAVQQEVTVSAAAVPDDPAYASQWGVRRVGLPELWPAAGGGDGVLIAIIDTGLDVALPDFAGRTVGGYDFVGGDAVPEDVNGHGTAAASIAAAATGNGTGVAGACGSCRIMPLKALDDEGRGVLSDVADAVVYAVDHGASVINMSLGGTATTAALDAALTYAADRDVLLVGAAGNAGTTARHWPAAHERVLGVAGSDQQDARYPWSSYGPWASLAAPGCNPAQRPGGAVTGFCGTSSAAPLVAGAAAALRSLEPGASAGQVAAALTSTAVASSFVAAGRIDVPAAAAVLAPAPPTPSLTAPRDGDLVSGVITLAAQGGSGPVDFLVDDVAAASASAAPYRAELDTRTLADGRHTVSARAGGARSGTVEIRVDNTAPTAGLAAPAAGATVKGSVTVTASAEDAAGVAQVQVKAAGRLLGTETAAPYTFRWDSTAEPDGPVSLAVRVVDDAGNVAEAPTVTVTVANGPASPPAQPTAARLAGASRFDTAAAISRAAFAPGVPQVYVGTAADYPDALAAGAAAAAEGAPVLLVGRDTLPVATGEELARLQPDAIIVVGGPAAIADDVVTALRAYAPTRRIAGGSRYATARAVAEHAFRAPLGVAYVASGRDFPDALAGGPAAGAVGAPLLLTDPAALPADTRAALDALRPRRIVVLGGPGAVSAAVLDDLGALAPVRRIAGGDRFATAAAVARDAFPATVDVAYLATGRDFPDALAGGPAAAVLGAPLLLTEPGALPPATADALRALRPRRVVALGGEGAVSPAVLEAAAGAARGQPEDSPPAEG